MTILAEMDPSVEKNRIVTSADEHSVDLPSKEKKHGWDTIDGVHVPCIFRKDDPKSNELVRYTATSIIQDLILFGRYEEDLLVTGQRMVGSHPMTSTEAQWFTEIIHDHCDEKYRRTCVERDKIVSVDQVKIFVDYLKEATAKRVQESSSHSVIEPRHISGEKNIIQPLTSTETNKQPLTTPISNMTLSDLLESPTCSRTVQNSQQLQYNTSTQHPAITAYSESSNAHPTVSQFSQDSAGLSSTFPFHPKICLAAVHGVVIPAFCVKRNERDHYAVPAECCFLDIFNIPINYIQDKDAVSYAVKLVGIPVFQMPPQYHKALLEYLDIDRATDDLLGVCSGILIPLEVIMKSQLLKVKITEALEKYYLTSSSGRK